MGIGKHMQHYGAVPLGNNNNTGGGEIRSGMSVQDLKQLTAQRAQRQCMEFWEQQVRNSPRQTVAGDWGYVSSPSAASTCSSTFSASPPRQYGASSAASSSSASGSSSSYPYSGGYGQQHRRCASGARGFSSDKMFVTYGGQVVSFMEGVVNAPQGDYLSDA